MGKNSIKTLIGQSIFKQIINLIPRNVVNKVVFEYGGDRYYKSFSTFDELLTLLFGVFERCDSAREVCDGMAALSGTLNHLGMDCAPAKSSFNDALNRRSEKIFEAIYFALLSFFTPILSDSRKEGIRFKHFFAFDSTTIRLFSEVLKGVGRKLKGLGKQKGGMKVHMLTDVHADCAKFVKMSEARMHDKKFLQYLNCLTAGCMIVFDKAYNFYLQFAKWTEAGIFFVCRLKDNAKYEILETLFETKLSEKQAGVMKVEHIHLQYKEDKTQKTLSLRKSNTNKAFSTVAALIRIHFISYLDLYWLVNNGRRSYQKHTKSKNKIPNAVQMLLFDG